MNPTGNPDVRDTWRVLGGARLITAPFVIMGVLNATPDSFYDGGRHDTLEQAVAHGLAMAEAGAGIIDVGGESTRPNASMVPAEEEEARVFPVLEALSTSLAEQVAGKPRQEVVRQCLRPQLSVDTYKARVAAGALERGASIVNDVSACRFDPGLLDVLAQHKPGYVLMHSLGRPRDMQRDPHYGDVIHEILAFFEERLGVLVRAGLPEEHVVLDPGIGFGKLLEHNVAILRDIEAFTALGRPLLLGLSNKSLWGGLLGLDVGERGTATQIGTALMAARGVRIHRVHDVIATARTLSIVHALGAVQAGE